MSVPHWWGRTETYKRDTGWIDVKDIDDLQNFENEQLFKLTPIKEDRSRTPEQVQEEKRVRKARRQQIKKSKKRNR